MYNRHFCLSLCICLLVGVAYGDVAHVYPQEFAFFHHQHHHPQQQQHQHHQQNPFHVAPVFVVPQPVAPPAATTLATLYGVPTTPTTDVGYPQPQPVTHSPVAPTRPSTASTTAAPTTTEFTLPEIVENRSFKQEQQHHYHNFIPLNNIFGGGGGGGGSGGINQYLPPTLDEQHPNYESPDGGYYYPRPVASTSTTTSTTTTERPRPIVVAEPPLLLPPLADTPSSVGGLSYNYNSPVGPAFTLPPPLPSPSPPPPIFRSSTPAPAYLPANAAVGLAAGEDDASSVAVEHLDPNLPPLRVRIQEMRCLQQSAHGGGGYFRSVLKLNSFIGATPTVEDATNGSGDNKRCEPRLTRSFVLVDIAEAHFAYCGVRRCGKDLCLRLRFPAIRGMRTGWDSILTLHCKAQDRVAIKTHALKMGVTNEVQARSLGTYARGGAQNQFRTHIELQRRNGEANGGGYVSLQDAHNGNAVQLGEELLLRAHVIPGDGWNYTKLSDVSLQRISTTGELLNSANLITPSGCLNPSMQSVCTQAPIFEAPLGHRLGFRAVMFQGMHSGDELVLTMRITGCLEQADCQVNALECSGSSAGDNLSRQRRRRDIAATQNATEISEVSHIAFRVLKPSSTAETKTDTEAVQSVDALSADVMFVPQRTMALAGSLLFVAALAFVGLFAWWWQLKWQQ